MASGHGHSNWCSLSANSNLLWCCAAATAAGLRDAVVSRRRLVWLLSVPLALLQGMTGARAEGTRERERERERAREQNAKQTHCNARATQIEREKRVAKRGDAKTRRRKDQQDR